MPQCRMAVVFLLVVVFGASMLSAQTGGAMLYANGNAKVNGQAAGDSTSIFSGDKVDVTDSSSVSINRSGSSVVLSPNSSIQYQPASVEVIQGSARVSTSQGMSASAGQVVISPKDSVAKFDVVRTGDKVVVVSREGALTVKDGTRVTVVQSGARTELGLVSTNAQASSADQGPKVASANFLPTDRLVEHPFYGVVKGVDDSPATLPICPDVLECIRPQRSNIYPCCCPPRVLCH